VRVQIKVARSGGFAGLKREATVDTECVSVDQRERLERLVAEAQFFDLPERAASGVADAIRYRVRVECDGHVREVATDDQSGPEPLIELARRVLEGA